MGAATSAATGLRPSGSRPGAGRAEVVVAATSEGMGASLRAGLRRSGTGRAGVTAVIILLVDTPGVTPETVARLHRLAGSSGTWGAGPGRTTTASPATRCLIGREHSGRPRSGAVGEQRVLAVVHIGSEGT